MGRIRSQERQERERVAEALADHGVPRGFALKVAETYVERGAPDALVQLYAGGWELHFTYDDERRRGLEIRRSLGMTGGNGENKINI